MTQPTHQPIGITQKACCKTEIQKINSQKSWWKLPNIQLPPIFNRMFSDSGTKSLFTTGLLCSYCVSGPTDLFGHTSKQIRPTTLPAALLFLTRRGFFSPSFGVFYPSKKVLTSSKLSMILVALDWSMENRVSRRASTGIPAAMAASIP